MRRKKMRCLILGAMAAVCLLTPGLASAFEIGAYSNMPVQGDFVLGPGKVELFLAPGESTVRNLTITNRTGSIAKIKIDIEDFTGDPVNATRLLGEEKGPYSLKDYLKPEKMEFSLAHGEYANLPITVSIPADATPGGLYGSVIVRVLPPELNASAGGQETAGQISVTSRLAALFFIRVKGDIKEDGALKSFTVNKKIYQHGPVDFSIVYQNNGTVHENPYASIEITNIMNKTIDQIDVSPWFVMPGFSRNRSVSWDKAFTFGRYTAHLSLNRGYNNLVDEATVNFWILPWRVIVIAGGVILLLALFIWWFTSKFEFKRKAKS